MEIGFRWDFLLYSAMAVVVGWYFVFKQNFEDEYYHWIYNTFLATNAIWVLVIRASYSNRLAQISWFIMPERKQRLKETLFIIPIGTLF